MVNHIGSGCGGDNNNELLLHRRIKANIKGKKFDNFDISNSTVFYAISIHERFSDMSRWNIFMAASYLWARCSKTTFKPQFFRTLFQVDSVVIRKFRASLQNAINGFCSPETTFSAFPFLKGHSIAHTHQVQSIETTAWTSLDNSRIYKQSDWNKSDWWLKSKHIGL